MTELNLNRCERWVVMIVEGQPAIHSSLRDATYRGGQIRAHPSDLSDSTLTPSEI